MAAPLASTSSAPRKPPPKPLDPYANYSTAASLGYSDPDAERFAAETGRRRTQGVAGDWEVVTSSSATSAETSSSAAANTLEHGAETAVDEEDGRQFKLRKKTLKVGLGEIYDPGIIPVKFKKKETTPPPDVTGVTSVHIKTQKWTPVQREPTSEVATTEDRVGPASTEGDDLALEVEGPLVKVEEDLAATTDKHASIDDPALSYSARDSSTDIMTAGLEEVEVLPLSTADSSGSMFRKRKQRPNGNKGRA
jgi:WW domain-binding protein 4